MTPHEMDARRMTPQQRLQAAAGRVAPSSTTVDILIASLSKALEHPHVEKYRKVNLAHPEMKRVSEQRGSMELLYAVGFEPHYGHLLLNTYDQSLLRSALEALHGVQSTEPYLSDREVVKRKRSAEATRAEAERHADVRRREHAAMLPEEPAEGDDSVAKVCVHLDGKMVWRRFDSTVDTLRDLLNWVKSLPGAPTSPHLENVTMKPALPLDTQTQLGKTLHTLDLWPAGHVRVSCAA